MASIFNSSLFKQKYYKFFFYILGYILATIPKIKIPFLESLNVTPLLVTYMIILVFSWFLLKFFLKIYLEKKDISVKNALTTFFIGIVFGINVSIILTLNTLLIPGA